MNTGKVRSGYNSGLNKATLFTIRKWYDSYLFLICLISVQYYVKLAFLHAVITDIYTY